MFFYGIDCVHEHDYDDERERRRESGAVTSVTVFLHAMRYTLAFGDLVIW